MAVPRGSAAYKKKDGIITFTDDKKSLIWIPGPGTGPPVVSLPVVRIEKVQQTPDSNPKVVLKVIEKTRTDDAEPVSYVFHYTSGTNARSEANAIKGVLSDLIALARADDPNLPRPLNQGTSTNGGSAGASAAMSMASTANAKPSMARWFDDSTLMKDAELQQSLLRKDPSLGQVYSEARSIKPESISDASFDAQFWSNRVGLLRAHAIELNQSKGAYNVLSTIKPRLVDGDLKLSLSKEQVHMIFQQHPLVKRIYNENVPKPLSEGEFWSRFFLSRLSKRLKGERILQNEGGADLLFDKYSEADNTMGFASKITASQVPHIIDLKANEENQGGFKGGNRADVEMRPRNNVPIIRTLNNLSEKIMAEIAPTDSRLVASAPEGGGVGDANLDNTFRELALRDLTDETETQKITLNVERKNNFFQNQGLEKSEESKIYEKQKPSEVLSDLRADIASVDRDESGGVELDKLIGIDDDSESDNEAPDGGVVKKEPHVGSRAARRAADEQIFESLEKTYTELYGLDTDEDSPMDIPPDITQKCLLTNATSIEFLKQFWDAFLSGDPKRVDELAYHADAVKRSIERIRALADEAEATRVKLDNQRKQDIREHYKKTGKKLRYIPVEGGKNAVMAFFATTLAALNEAQDQYTSAWKK